MNVTLHKLRASLQNLWKANARATAIGNMLNTGRATAAARVLTRAFAATPDQPFVRYLLGDLDIERSEKRDENTMCIALKSGRVFLGERSHRTEYPLHNLFEDRLPPAVDADSYELALDIQKRYFEVSLQRYCRGGGVLSREDARNVNRVKVLDTASYYSQEGRQNSDVVRQMLKDMGCTILRKAPAGRIRAVTPKFPAHDGSLKPYF